MAQARKGIANNSKRTAPTSSITFRPLADRAAARLVIWVSATRISPISAGASQYLELISFARPAGVASRYLTGMLTATPNAAEKTKVIRVNNKGSLADAGSLNPEVAVKPAVKANSSVARALEVVITVTPRASSEVFRFRSSVSWSAINWAYARPAFPSGNGTSFQAAVYSGPRHW
jgi:hypothetical protein